MRAVGFTHVQKPGCRLLPVRCALVGRGGGRGGLKGFGSSGALGLGMGMGVVAPLRWTPAPGHGVGWLRLRLTAAQCGVWNVGGRGGGHRGGRR